MNSTDYYVAYDIANPADIDMVTMGAGQSFTPAGIPT